VDECGYGLKVPGDPRPEKLARVGPVTTKNGWQDERFLPARGPLCSIFDYA
jgi:hypothetical protein